MVWQSLDVTGTLTYPTQINSWTDCMCSSTVSKDVTSDGACSALKTISMVCKCTQSKTDGAKLQLDQGLYMPLQCCMENVVPCAHVDKLHALEQH